MAVDPRREFLDAHRHDPVSATDAELLHAIPVNALDATARPGRRRDGHQTVPGHNRHRRAGTPRRACRRPAGSLVAALTADSFRQTAASATVISHNCATMLSSLAVLAQERGVPALARDLLTSARAAEAARTTWLAAAQAWSRITTDARAAISPAAAEPLISRCGPGGSPTPIPAGPRPTARSRHTARRTTSPPDLAT